VCGDVKYLPLTLLDFILWVSFVGVDTRILQILYQFAGLFGLPEPEIVG